MINKTLPNQYNIKKILLDLDNCIVDLFDIIKKTDITVPDMEEHINVLSILGKKQEYISPLIFKAIEKNLFEKAKPTLFLTALTDVLLPYWKELNIEVEILSSTMKENPLRESLTQQKIKWCKHYLPHLKVNLVEGSTCKKDYAAEGILLIDDYDRTIAQFIQNKGYGLQYTSLNNTMKQLRLLGLTP